MKKTISTLLVAVLLISSMFLLVSCGGLSGSYKSGTTTLDFSGDNVTIKFEVTVVVTISKTSTAKYQLGNDDNGNRTITFTYGDGQEENSLLANGIALPFSEGSDDKGSYIKIAGVTFYKQ